MRVVLFAGQRNVFIETDKPRNVPEPGSASGFAGQMEVYTIRQMLYIHPTSETVKSSAHRQNKPDAAELQRRG